MNGPGAPAATGAVLVIYGTGAGVTAGPVQTGVAAPDNSTTPATVTIAGRIIAPIFAGLTPGSVGLTQVNVAVPAGIAPSNAIPLQFSMNNATTQTVNISVR